MHIGIRSAKTNDSGVLTDISLRSKRYWKYPEAYFAIWEKELTITDRYIENNTVFVAEADGIPVAYYALVHVTQDFFCAKIPVKSGWWLEHMFVLPEWIGKGIGRRMTGHLFCFCKRRGIEKLNVFADPNAKGFYEKAGFSYVAPYPSSIEGRTVCLFEKVF